MIAAPRRFNTAMTDGSDRPKGSSLRPLRALAPYVWPYRSTLVLAMGGDITVDSTLGGGSTFHLTLPLRTGTESEPGAEPTMRLTPGEGPLVLVIDDDADARELYRRTLTGAGYSVAEASTGEIGLAVARPAEMISLHLVQDQEENK